MKGVAKKVWKVLQTARERCPCAGNTERSRTGGLVNLVRGFYLGGWMGVYTHLPCRYVRFITCDKRGYRKLWG